MPRLTAVLRALTTEQAAPFDPDQAYVARQQALQQRSRQQQQQPGSNGGLLPPATALGQDSLAQQIIGQWSKGGCSLTAPDSPVMPVRVPNPNLTSNAAACLCDVGSGCSSLHADSPFNHDVFSLCLAYANGHD